MHIHGKCMLFSLYQRNKDIQIEHVCGQSTIFPAKNARLFFLMNETAEDINRGTFKVAYSS